MAKDVTEPRTTGPKAEDSKEANEGKTDGDPESQGVADWALGNESEGHNEAVELSVTKHEAEAEAAAPKASTSKAKASA